MKTCGEIRKEAWKILNGKWMWRLFLAAALLQGISFLVVNVGLTSAFDAMSITSLGGYIEAKIKAAQQGLCYALPTTKAYIWMIGGFCLQTFISYVFGAIFAFGFAGLLLKARENDDSRWFSESFGGFMRPLDLTGLLILMNLLVFLAFAAGCVVCGGLAAWYVVRTGIAITSPVSIALWMLALMLSFCVAMPVVYAYRQAWFLKTENPSMSSVECLRRSRQMMRGFKAKAFCLDLSYAGWLTIVALLLMFSSSAGAVAFRGGSIVANALSFITGAIGFWLLIKTVLGMFVSRAIFYKELAPRPAGAGEDVP